MNQKQKTIEIYKEKDKVKVFDEARNKYLYQKHKHKIESSFLKNNILLLNKNKIRVLDVACGTGRMLPEVFSVKKNIEYVGMDTSESMTKDLKEKAKILGIEKQVKVKKVMPGFIRKFLIKEGY